MLRRRRDEVGTARIVVIPSDPVLVPTDDPRNVRMGGLGHQLAMDLRKVFDADPLAGGRVINCQLHGIDVPKYFQDSGW